MHFNWQVDSLVVWAVIDFGVSLVASAHVVLHKRSARAAVGWVGVIWLAPFLGSSLYLLLGINRIERNAKRRRPSDAFAIETCDVPTVAETEIEEVGLRDLMRLGSRITDLPVTAGNSVSLLINGDQAYPAMLQAIDQAKQSITLATYIFDRDRVGLRFVEALGRAVARGVEVRVLIDMVGATYRIPTIRRALVRSGVTVAYFLPTLLPWRMHYSNLRNHRKLLIVDGQLAFTGGMNIRQEHEVQVASGARTQDLHVQIAGPLVGQLQEVFATDWCFTTGELLQGSQWFCCAARVGQVPARCIADGPDEALDRTRKLLHGAVSVAKRSIVIVTPYFLPDEALITALNTAALRGVRVEIFLPQRGNLRFVEWAATAQLWQVLEHGCRVWLTPPPFDHTKLMLVDDHWSLVGSSNWDPRSLRLNFELNVELYSSEVAHQLAQVVDQRRQAARELTLHDVQSRPLWRKLRDGVARLLSPYL